MCGRFTKNYTWQQIQALYRLTVPAAIPNMQPKLQRVPNGPRGYRGRARGQPRAGSNALGIGAVLVEQADKVISVI